MPSINGNTFLHPREVIDAMIGAASSFRAAPRGGRGRDGRRLGGLLRSPWAQAA